MKTNQLVRKSKLTVLQISHTLLFISQTTLSTKYLVVAQNFVMERNMVKGGVGLPFARKQNDPTPLVKGGVNV